MSLCIFQSPAMYLGYWRILYTEITGTKHTSRTFIDGNTSDALRLLVVKILIHIVLVRCVYMCVYVCLDE